MKKPQNSHDKAFKNLMRQKPFAEAFIKQYFSMREWSRLNMTTLELWNANFIVENSESQSDVVYKVKTVVDEDFYIILLFEHQSKPEKLMPFRLLEYSVLLMRQHLDQKNDKLPVIMPVVFYHGQTSPYPYSSDIFDCFENPELAREYYLKPFKLIDVTVIPDEELKKNIITAPLQIIMKHIRDKDLLPVFRELADSEILVKNARIGQGKLFLDVIYYAMSAGKISDRQEFKTLLLNQPDEVRRNFMTYLELHQRDIEQSIQQEKYLIAKNLLSMRFKFEDIAKATELPIDIIQKLKKEIEPA